MYCTQNKISCNEERFSDESIVRLDFGLLCRVKRMEFHMSSSATKRYDIIAFDRRCQDFLMRDHILPSILLWLFVQIIIYSRSIPFSKCNKEF
jgi:hypothetical protein